MAVAIALIRGFARRRSPTIGNFWVDLTRGTLYVLLPICVIAAFLLMAQGVSQTLAPSVEVTTLEGGAQIIARGPVATQEAIKLLGGDGGGFFNANSAHPFENPTPLTNLAETLLIFALGAALTNCFGRMVGSERQGMTILPTVMAILFGCGPSGLFSSEADGNPGARRLECRSDDERATTRPRKHGRQGSAVRNRRISAFFRGFDGILRRRGQLDAR